MSWILYISASKIILGNEYSNFVGVKFYISEGNSLCGGRLFFIELLQLFTHWFPIFNNRID